MGSLDGPAIVPVDQMSLQAAGSGNEVVGKREPRSLASEGASKVPLIVVGLTTGNASPPGNQGFFDSHGAVEIRNKTVASDGRNIGEGGSFEAADLFEPWLVHLYQGCDLDEWPGATGANDIASLAEHHHSGHLLQQGRGSGLNGLAVIRKCRGHLRGSRTVRTGHVGEMNKLQASVQGDISLTPCLKGFVDRSFVLFR